MAYRILVDENIDPAAVGLLHERGHDAVHMRESVGPDTEDSPIAEHARQNGYLVLTNDTDVLRPERRQGLSVLYCPENAMRAHEVARLVDTLAETIPEQSDLPTVTYVTDETLSG